MNRMCHFAYFSHVHFCFITSAVFHPFCYLSPVVDGIHIGTLEAIADGTVHIGCPTKDSHVF